MASARSPQPDPSVFRNWLESLSQRDPRLYAELSDRLRERVVAREAVSREAALPPPDAGSVRDLVVETIVREGRPALLIADNRISPTDGIADVASREMLGRLTGAAATVEPRLPLVGRIDVANYPGTLSYVGTGWLVDDGIVVTNRHVAQLLARPDGRTFTFRPGRFGESLMVSIDFRHEKGIDRTDPVAIERVVWIEPDETKADIAFIQIERRTGGPQEPSIPLAESDPAPETDVAVVGYPARAPADVIPDQARMDEIYGSTYDVKRIAPGRTGATSRGWLTHDCTTLGGNSGSVVLDLRTGKAVGLHFAGLYMIENYAVPASMVRAYLRDRPWHPTGERGSQPMPSNRRDSQGSKPQELSVRGGSVSFTIPVHVTVSLGQPVIDPTPDSQGGSRSGTLPIDDAARELFRQHLSDAVLAVRPGYLLDGNRLTDTDCLAVAAQPDRLAEARAKLPKQFAGYPVDVRPASLTDQAAAISPLFDVEAVTSIMYNDEDRTGEGFSFDPIEEHMKLTLHVGPERSWSVLSSFLEGATTELSSSIYEFHAKHIADAIEERLDAGSELRLVMAQQSRDPKSGNIPAGEFDRSEEFNDWEQRFGNKFERVFVPLGKTGLVANSYHIKVTVRDKKTVWLSSGNWTRTSQPLIAAQNLNNPKKTTAAGNREWHVVVEKCETLARRFRNHIRADFEQSLNLGGTPEAVGEPLMVDVPLSLLEAPTLEAAAARVVEPKPVEGTIKVQPLLTPDRKGAVYTDAVLELIESAQTQLLFQNQYIKMSGADSGNLKKLVDALVDKADLQDFRIILRSENDSLVDDVSALKRRGVDIDRSVRRVSNTHTKGIIVDGKRVLLGSHNWSKDGVSLNRDASLIFDNETIAQYYADVFQLDWDRALEVMTESVVSEAVSDRRPRLAVGDAPPPGFVRMPLAEYLEG